MKLPKIDDFLKELNRATSAELLDVRPLVTNIYTLQKDRATRAENGNYTDLAEAQRDLAHADFYLTRLEQEIERRKLLFPTPNVSVANNYGIVQTGTNSMASMIINKLNIKEMSDNSNSSVSNSVVTNINGGTNAVNIAVGHTVNQTGNVQALSLLQEQLENLGVDPAQIEEMNQIVCDSKDKQTFMSKALSWIGGVSLKLAEKALIHNLPAITEAVHNFAATL